MESGRISLDLNRQGTAWTEPPHRDVSQLEADLVTSGIECRDDEPAAFQQKLLMMQEVHHRVRNSLQLVQSLLNSQAMQSSDAAAASQLRDGAARIHVIGAIHERLSNGAVRDIDIQLYLQSLIEDLCAGFISSGSDRQIILESDVARWPPSDIPTLGLVLTELVTNALKYGEGTVRVHFRQKESGRAVLIVEDEGKLPPHFDLSRNSGFGIRLIQALVEQRDGSLTIDPHVRHTCFTVNLQHVKPAAEWLSFERHDGHVGAL
jgi:two-component sensor histidine kinase